ncbi:hypothetical protein PInf_002792 [Phytophthora infestans]|nr:hypothetical protein PInf_002792 [Phytophthora infestans]
MGAGIIAAFKVAYRQKQLEWVYNKIKHGDKIDKKAYKVGQLTAMQWSKAIWLDLREKQTVQNCFRHTGILYNAVDDRSKDSICSGYDDLEDGAVTHKRMRILLDTGGNASVNTDTFAKKLRLQDVPDHGRRIGIQGFCEGKVSTTRRACVKITLGWEMVYEFEMWVMTQSVIVDVVLGTDFMIPAGIRLDLFHIQISLIKTKNMVDSEEYGSHVDAGPPERLETQVHEWREYRLAKRQVGLYLSAHDSMAIWMPDGELPRGDGYVRLDSQKYQD